MWSLFQWLFICLFLKTSALIRIFALVQQASGPEYTQVIQRSLPEKSIFKYSRRIRSTNGQTSMWIPLTSCKANNESPCTGVKPHLPSHSSCVTLGMLINIWDPQVPHLWKRKEDYLLIMVLELRQIIVLREPMTTLIIHGTCFMY